MFDGDPTEEVHVRRSDGAAMGGRPSKEGLVLDAGMRMYNIRGGIRCGSVDVTMADPVVAAAAEAASEALDAT